MLLSIIAYSTKKLAIQTVHISADHFAIVALRLISEYSKYVAPIPPTMNIAASEIHTETAPSISNPIRNRIEGSSGINLTEGRMT